MAANENTMFQVNIKTPNGSLINLYAASVTELDEQVDAMIDRVSSVVALETAFAATGMVARSVSVAPPAEQRAAQAAYNAAPAPAAGGPNCNCGIPAKLVPGGISKTTGKPYKAFYACSQPREMQCGFRANS